MSKQRFLQAFEGQTPTYADDRLAIIEDLRQLSVFSSEFKVESYAAALLTKGTASFFVNGESYEMNANDLFIFHPYITLDRTMVSADAEYCIVVLSPEYTESLALLNNTGIDIKLFLDKSPVIRLPQEQVTTFIQYYQILRSRLMGRKTRYHSQLVDALLSAFLYDFYDVLEQSFQIHHLQYTSAEVILRKFYDILYATEHKFQKVDYFAKQLNVTPKYFSAVCKKITGKTALQLITEAVLKEVHILLRKDTLSIKEIATIVGFPNQSFFGSYVRKHLGCSPQKYREKLNNRE